MWLTNLQVTFQSEYMLVLKLLDHMCTIVHYSIVIHLDCIMYKKYIFQFDILNKGNKICSPPRNLRVWFASQENNYAESEFTW